MASQQDCFEVIFILLKKLGGTVEFTPAELQSVKTSDQILEKFDVGTGTMTLEVMEGPAS